MKSVTIYRKLVVGWFLFVVGFAWVFCLLLFGGVGFFCFCFFFVCFFFGGGGGRGGGG